MIVPPHMITPLSSNTLKYTILGLIKGGDESGYRSVIEETLVNGEENDLILNVAKTREVIADFRRNPAPLQPLYHPRD